MVKLGCDCFGVAVLLLMLLLLSNDVAVVVTDDLDRVFAVLITVEGE